MKTTKLQTLNENLVVAKAALDAARARLCPQIVAAQAEVDALRAAMDKADKAHSKAYANYQAAERNVRARLFPVETSKQLRTAIQAHVAEKFPQADVERLAREFEGAKVAADAEYVAAKTASSQTWDAREKAGRAWNVATNPGGKLAKLRYELEKYTDAVEKLEKEIERLPRYRQNAKDRRDAERQEAVAHEQTQAARELMVNFTFGA